MRLLAIALTESDRRGLVKTGDAIATIDDSRLQTKKSQLESSIGQIKLQLIQIDAQIHALDNQVVAQTDSSNRAVAAAEAELSSRGIIEISKLLLLVMSKKRQQMSEQQLPI